MLFPDLRARIGAICLCRKVRASIINEEWVIENLGVGETILTRGEYTIIIEPRRLRIFDKISLHFGDSEVWIPLIPRIRLRSVVRWLIVSQALKFWNPPICKKVRSTSRKK